MDQTNEAKSKANPAEPRHDRLLAVLLEGVLDLEMAAARTALERSKAPPRLVDRALRLLRQEFSMPGFEHNALAQRRHPALSYLEDLKIMDSSS